ncbi:MAG TPA: YabP/YqfC family sporulation protein [Pseudogracilibacillus sp.]|nr:YabP/YqfC family sporulation protein [Pseudogracilibacillus sp.]
MKGFKGLWHMLTDLSDDEQYPLIMIYRNRKITIEQVERLITFSPKEIVLLHERGKIAITGKDLFISFMYNDEITLVGMIEEILFLSDKGGANE